MQLLMQRRWPDWPWGCSVSAVLRSGVHGVMLPDQDGSYSALLIFVGRRPLFVHQPAWAEISKVKCYKTISQLLELSHYCH